MKKPALALAALLLMLTLPAPAPAGDRHQDDQRKTTTTVFFQKQADQLYGAKAAPAAGGESSGVTFLFIPEFHYSSHGDLSTKLGGVGLKSSSGDASSIDFVLVGTKAVNDLVTVGLTYQLAFTSYSGGLLVPSAPLPGGGYFSGKSDLDTISNLIGIDMTLNFKEKGRFNIGFAQAWDIYNGNETFRVHDPDGSLVRSDKRSADEFKTRVSSIMAWYDLDVPVNDCWTVNPYLGWRSIYAVASNQNVWDAPRGTKTGDDGEWAHLASAGLKLKYQAGLLGAYMRAGVNHRVSTDDIPGFGSRAMAPGVVHLGYLTNFDRTVGTWGLGLNYVIPEKFIIDFSYNGYAGSDVDVHSAIGTLVFPF